ncbi:hypothetical protein Ccar_02520 [Clostridium carboxidivorans P7]|uniref:Uncharacterized protein n=1 Tax=Clostridium carboxidivorans P7 TaxID=536227 RepID=C6Q301_9CLOT|nr:hypothetical protein [Clostridium carboxidivorans]AKN29781.1 hypothetical protein Ccar_02520 [Clostridium carboxidivorans P7]EET84132.1 conserved hypothetical protein [Clostridium carboxidivorans P7]
MIFYHFSSEKYSKLIPQAGEKRHLGKSKSIGKKVTFLTTNPNMFYENDNGGNFFEYRYILNIDKNDPHLYADDKFNNMMEKFNRTFGSRRGVFKWFFYDSPLDYICISKWNEKLCRFS